MSFTKERWEREGNKIKASGRGTIAVCPSPTNDCGVLDFIANAQLIVSAPKQNEALREIDQWLIENMVDYEDDGTLHIIHCHIQDALAKAEGK